MIPRHIEHPRLLAALAVAAVGLLALLVAPAMAASAPAVADAPALVEEWPAPPAEETTPPAAEPGSEASEPAPVVEAEPTPAPPPAEPEAPAPAPAPTDDAQPAEPAAPTAPAPPTAEASPETRTVALPSGPAQPAVIRDAGEADRPAPLAAPPSAPARVAPPSAPPDAPSRADVAPRPERRAAAAPRPRPDVVAALVGSARPDLEATRIGPAPGADDDAAAGATNPFATFAAAPGGPGPAGSSLLAVLASYVLPGTGLPASTLLLLVQLAVILAAFYAPRSGPTERIHALGLHGPRHGYRTVLARPG